MNPSCDGKRQFLTFTQARGAARNAKRSNRTPMHPYMCRECHKFHIANTPRAQKLTTKRPRD